MIDEVQQDIDFEFGQDPKPRLPESRRRKLDSIIVQMDKQGATREEIMSVVEDYKSRYATKPLVVPQEKARTSPTFGAAASMAGSLPSFAEAMKEEGKKIVKVAPSYIKPLSIAETERRSKAIGEAKAAKEKILAELSSNDDVLEKGIRQHRFDVAGMNADVPHSETQATGMRRFDEPTLGPQEIPVTPEDMQAEKDDIAADEQKARNVLDNIAKHKPDKKRDIQKSVYWIDAVRSIQNEPNEEKRFSRLGKITENANQLSKGQLIYDVRSGKLIKPQGAVGSMITGWQHKSRGYDDYSFLNSKTDNEIIAEYEKRRTGYDPDEAIPVPKHMVNEMLQSLSAMPLKSLVAGGVVAAAGAPEAAPFVSGAVGAADFYRLGYANSFERTYNQLRDEGRDEQEALQMAKEQASREGAVDAAVGGSMSMIGARIGMKPLTFSQGYRKGVFDFIKGASKEGSFQGIIGGGGELLKNKLAQAAGITRDADENVLNAIESNFLLTVGMGVAANLGRGISQIKYRAILNGLSKAKPELLEFNIQSELDAGRITEQQANNIRNEVKAYKELDSQIPENVTEEARLEIQKKLERRNELEGRLESLNKAFHAEEKEKIVKLDEEITELAKQKEPRVAEDKNLKEAALLIEQAVDDGLMNDIYAGVARDNPEGFMKYVADQSFGRTDEGVMHDAGGVEGQMREQFGDAIVDKAKEMFPLRGEDQAKLYSLGEKIKVKERTFEDTNTHEIIINVKGIGEIVLGQEKGEPNYRVDYVRTDDSVRGKRMAKELYYEAIKLLNSRGLYLEPGGYSSPEVVSIWKRLESEGLAEIHSIVEGGEEPGNFIIKAKTTGGSPKQHESVTIKPKEDAVSIESADAVPVRETSADSGPVAEGVRNAEEPAGKEIGQEGNIAGEEKVVSDTSINEGDMTGITHQQMDETAREFGLETYREDPETIEQWDAQANERITKDPQAIAKLLNKMRNGQQPDAVEQRIMIRYVSSLKAKIRATPTDELLNELKRAKDLSNIVGGRDVAKSLRARQAVVPVTDSLGDMMIAKMEANAKEKLTPEEKADVIQKSEKIEKSKKSLRDKGKELADRIRALRPKTDSAQSQFFGLPIAIYDTALITIAEAVEQGAKLADAIQQGIAYVKQNKGFQNKKDEKLFAAYVKGQLTYDERLNAFKDRTQKSIEKLQDRAAAGDFEPDAKSILELDKEARQLKNELRQAKYEFELELQNDKIKNAPLRRKAARMAVLIGGLPRTLMTIVDFSGVLRQGAVATISHPVIASKAIPEMFKQTFNKTRFDEWLADVKESPLYDIIEKSKLYISDPNSLHLSAHEESFMSANLAEKIPLVKHVVKASERAYVSFLNKMRVDLFKNGVEVFMNEGKTIHNSPELYEGLASFINNATGRGKLGPLEGSADFLNTVFFSPRLMASRMNMLGLTDIFTAGQKGFYSQLPKEVRVMAIKDMLKFIAFGTVVLGLSKMGGAEVELDPRSTDFGKAKVGNTRYDIWGGFQPYVRLIAQVAYGQTKPTSTGEIKDLNPKQRFDRVTSFMRGKLAPVPGSIIDVASGENIIGEQATIQSEALESVTPMIINDVGEAMKEQGVKALFTIGLPSIFGIGATTYDASESKSGSGGRKREGRPSRPKRESRN